MENFQTCGEKYDGASFYGIFGLQEIRLFNFERDTLKVEKLWQKIMFDIWVKGLPKSIWYIISTMASRSECLFNCFLGMI